MTLSAERGEWQGEARSADVEVGFSCFARGCRNPVPGRALGRRLQLLALLAFDVRRGDLRGEGDAIVWMNRFVDIVNHLSTSAVLLKQLLSSRQCQ